MELPCLFPCVGMRSAIRQVAVPQPPPLPLIDWLILDKYTLMSSSSGEAYFRQIEFACRQIIWRTTQNYGRTAEQHWFSFLFSFFFIFFFADLSHFVLHINAQVYFLLTKSAFYSWLIFFSPGVSSEIFPLTITWENRAKCRHQMWDETIGLKPFFFDTPFHSHFFLAKCLRFCRSGERSSKSSKV